jgi:nucleotide-binding universal stress UspA family protein
MINLKRILCPVDLSESSMLALKLAYSVAGRYDAVLTVIHVLENPYMDIPGGETGAFSFGEILDLYREEREEEILDVIRHEDTPAVDFDVIFREGAPYNEIVEVARSIVADMIMLSTCTDGIHEVIAGCTTERVVRLAPCPVLSIRTDQKPEKQKKIEHLRDLMNVDPKAKRTILLPTDFSDHSELATNYAISMAQQYKAEVMVLHVMERIAGFAPAMNTEFPGYEAAISFYDDLLENAERRVGELCERISSYGVAVSNRIMFGNPRYEILSIASAEPIDLIIIGTHGRRGFSRLIHGSVAEAVVRHAQCSVLSVKRPEHDFIELDKNSNSGGDNENLDKL